MPGEEIVSLEDKETKQKINLMHYKKGCRWYSPYKMNGASWTT